MPCSNGSLSTCHRYTKAQRAAIKAAAKAAEIARREEYGDEAGFVGIRRVGEEIKASRGIARAGGIKPNIPVAARKAPSPNGRVSAVGAGTTATANTRRAAPAGGEGGFYGGDVIEEEVVVATITVEETAAEDEEDTQQLERRRRERLGLVKNYVDPTPDDVRFGGPPALGQNDLLSGRWWKDEQMFGEAVGAGSTRGIEEATTIDRTTTDATAEGGQTGAVKQGGGGDGGGGGSDDTPAVPVRPPISANVVWEEKIDDEGGDGEDDDDDDDDGAKKGVQDSTKSSLTRCNVGQRYSRGAWRTAFAAVNLPKVDDRRSVCPPASASERRRIIEGELARQKQRIARWGRSALRFFLFFCILHFVLFSFLLFTLGAAKTSSAKHFNTRMIFVTFFL